MAKSGSDMLPTLDTSETRLTTTNGRDVTSRRAVTPGTSFPRSVVAITENGKQPDTTPPQQSAEEHGVRGVLRRPPSSHFNFASITPVSQLVSRGAPKSC